MAVDTALESERDQARRELGDTLAAMADKVSATRDELYPPALTAGLLIAAGTGFVIGLRRDNELAPLAYAAAGYCGWKIFRRIWRGE
jgi:hypothetical protein